MKILIPLTSFGNSGGFRVLSELANNWIKMGHSVSFLSHETGIEPYFPTVGKLLWYDNNGEIFEKKGNGKRSRFRLIGVLISLRKAINKLEYDVIIANQCFTSFPVSFSKKCDKKFYYIQAYEPEYYTGNGIQSKFLNLLSKFSYRLKLDKIVNSPLYFNYEKIKANKCVYPGIDFKKFKPCDKANSDVFIIGCIGRIEPIKGTSYVLDAFEKLRQTNKNIQLHIAFGSKELEKIEGLKVIDIKNDNELARYYQKVNVIVAPGTYQLGAVHYPVIEAMACKTPVITTGYLPANESNSWIVPIKNSDAIKDAILDIIKSPDYLNERVNKAFTDVQEFGWEVVSEKMLSYFK
jgi:glycosyltransferase involved in cell wall biosynthesis